MIHLLDWGSNRESACHLHGDGIAPSGMVQRDPADGTIQATVHPAGGGAQTAAYEQERSAHGRVATPCQPRERRVGGRRVEFLCAVF